MCFDLVDEGFASVEDGGEHEFVFSDSGWVRWGMVAELEEMGIFWLRLLGG